MKQPFQYTSGPREAKVILVGEAWGESEDDIKRPFVGESGKMLFQLLGEAFASEPTLHAQASEMFKYGLAWVKKREAWLNAQSILLTNVFALRPPQNKIEALCLSKSELPKNAKSLPPISRGKYLDPRYFDEIDRLHAELALAKPNIVVALGNTATWALLGATNIGTIRGAIATTTEGLKVLPTYHPAAVMRMYSWKPILTVDLQKAARESLSPTLKRIERSIIADPTIEQVIEWTYDVLANPPRLMACDIETKRGQISLISFAKSISDALVVPFINESNLKRYWKDQLLEERAWLAVKELLESGIPLLFQNGLYDLQYIRRMRIKPAACMEDTMLLHHSLFPELQKGLGFLGSIYTNEAAWKLMRKAKPDTEKRDE